MSKKEADKIDTLTTNGLINLDDENSFAQFDLIAGQFKEEKRETIMKDEYKPPVYVSVTTEDDKGNKTVNTIWAESANYIENLGEGLEHTDKELYDSKGKYVTDEYSYGVRLKVAGEGKLGGVKLPESEDGETSITINSEGEIDVNFDKIANENIATSDKLGVVKIGKHLIIDNDGSLTYDPYELPVANENRLGGIKVGNGLEMISDGTTNQQKSVLTVNTKAYRQHPFAIDKDTDMKGANDYSRFEQLGYIVDKILDYVEELSAKYDSCYNQLSTLLDYDVMVYGGIITSNGRFNGREGVHIAFNDDLIKLLKQNGVKDYKVILTQSSSILGDLGDYIVMKEGNKGVPSNERLEGFTVYTTGKRNSIDEFTWMLIPDNIPYNNAKSKDPNSPDKYYYQVDSFKEQYMDINGILKPLCIFDDNRGLPIHHGHGIFSKESSGISKINFSNKEYFEDERYTVLLTPTFYRGDFETEYKTTDIDIENLIDSNGALVGEYYITDRDKTSFSVQHTGEIENNELIGFDWVAIPFGPETDLKKSSELVYDPYILPIRAGIVRSSSTDINGDRKVEDLYVDFGQNVFENRRYSIMCQIMSDTKGQIGEYCGSYKNKHRDSFYIEYSGNLTDTDGDDVYVSQFDMGWITIDRLTSDRVYAYDYYTVEIEFRDIDKGTIIKDTSYKQISIGKGYDFTYLEAGLPVPGYTFVSYEGDLFVDDGIIFSEREEPTIVLYYRSNGDADPVLVTDNDKALVANMDEIITIDPLDKE